MGRSPGFGTDICSKCNTYFEMGRPCPKCGTRAKDFPLVVAVAWQDAIAWLSGKFEDIDLFTRSPLVPEAVFIVNLPDRASYRKVLNACRLFHAQGARFAIARTNHPAVEHHMVDQNDCVRCFLEVDRDPPKWRIACPPAQFDRWLAKWAKRGCQHSDPPSESPATVKLDPEHFKQMVPWHPIGIVL